MRDEHPGKKEAEAGSGRGRSQTMTRGSGKLQPADRDPEQAQPVRVGWLHTRWPDLYMHPSLRHRKALPGEGLASGGICLQPGLSTEQTPHRKAASLPLDGEPGSVSLHPAHCRYMWYVLYVFRK